jgi:glucan phosphoethanolaminetransferase (alkaline phosphatase superfamily)
MFPSRLRLLVVLLLVSGCSRVSNCQSTASQPKNKPGISAQATASQVEGVVALSPELEPLGDLPKIVNHPKIKRNVLLIVSESLRQDAWCSVSDASCTKTPYTQKVVPNRIEWNQMRSISSATATAWQAMLTGVPPTASPRSMKQAPMIFDYAKAAGWDTAFWSSQMIELGKTWVFVRDIPARSRITGLALEPGAPPDVGAQDQRVTNYAAEHLSELKEPFLAIIQLANTHFPYRVRSGDEPFQPASLSKGKSEKETLQFRNYYQNSVVGQDHSVAELLESLRKKEIGQRTVVIFTADHGEAFREHHQVGHTFSVFEEEVRIPAWMDAPQGTLTVEEEKQLRSFQNQARFSIDWVPTILELMGIAKEKAIRSRLALLPGTSFFQDTGSSRAVPLSNCSEHWGCHHHANYGLLSFPRKVLAREHDKDWQCFDVQKDPSEQHPLHDEGCSLLGKQALQVFGGLPSTRGDQLSQPG